MPHTLALLSPSNVVGGNFCTMSRIRSHLAEQGHTCHLWNASHLENQGDLRQVLQEQQVDLLIGIHAFRTGRILKDCGKPYIMILGGTDVNEFSKDESKMAVMTEALERASYVISFSELLQQKAQTVWPMLSLDHSAVIPQAVVTDPDSFSLHDHLRERCGVSDSRHLHVFLLVAAIRPVKNPLYLLHTFSEWHKAGNNVLLVIVGPASDKVYYEEQFLPALKRSEGVVHIESLTFEETHAAMTQCFAVVNSSESEGMSLAILEAMQLNVPVLARDITGNRAVIKDGQTGVLFSSPGDFRRKASNLMEEGDYRSRLVGQAAKYIADHHSMELERKAYADVVQACLASPGAGANGDAGNL